MKSGITLIKEERERQQLVEGWGPYHDDQHTSGEINDAAISYATASAKQARGEGDQSYLKSLEEAGVIPWPWESSWWKPSDDPIRNLVKAGALIAAEIDRLQRLSEDNLFGGDPAEWDAADDANVKGEATRGLKTEHE